MIQQALIVVSVLFVITVLALAAKISSISKNNKQLAKELSNLRNNSNESYIKFLTDSRDWAFQYIEETQEGIIKFANQVEPQLNYFNTYGRAVPSHNDIALDVITKAFSELKTLLPEENKEKNK